MESSENQIRKEYVQSGVQENLACNDLLVTSKLQAIHKLLERKGKWTVCRDLQISWELSSVQSKTGAVKTT